MRLADERFHFLGGAKEGLVHVEVVRELSTMRAAVRGVASERRPSLLGDDQATERNSEWIIRRRSTSEHLGDLAKRLSLRSVKPVLNEVLRLIITRDPGRKSSEVISPRLGVKVAALRGASAVSSSEVWAVGYYRRKTTL
jgi:hypothetical protein